MGYDGADVKQFELRASDGKAYAGAGAVILDKDGITLSYVDQVSSQIKWGDRAVIGAYQSAPYDALWLQAEQPTVNTRSGMIRLDAVAPAGSSDSILYVVSGRFLSGGFIDLDVGGASRLKVYEGFVRIANDLRVGEGLYVGATGVNPDDNDIWVADDVRIGGGLYVGQLGVDPGADDIWCDGLISTDGGTVQWELGNSYAGTPTCDRYIQVWIIGTRYHILAEYQATP